MADSAILPESNYQVSPNINFETKAGLTNNDGVVLDKNWAKRSFLVPNNDIADTGDKSNRYSSTATMKFTDTRAGGNIGINSRPQFTRYTDIRNKGLLSDLRSDVTVNGMGNEYGFGMGRYYSEAIDDNSRFVFLRFGVPQFNYLTRYFSNAFNYGDAYTARTGRSPPVTYSIGTFAGYIARLYYFPILTAVMFAYNSINTVFGLGSNKFYTVKPTMHTYWSSVNSIVNNLAVNLGLLSLSFGTPDGDMASKMYSAYKFDTDTIAFIKKNNPQFFGAGQTIDVFAIAGKAQRTANVIANLEYQDRANGADQLGTGLVNRYSKAITGVVNKNPPGFSQYLNEAFNFTYYNVPKTTSVDPSGTNPYSKSEYNGFLDPNNISPPVSGAGNTVTPLPLDPALPNAATNAVLTGNKQQETMDTPPVGFIDEIKNYFSSSVRDGFEYLTIRVEGAESVSDSFSNSSKDSEIAGMLNSVTKKVEDIRFSTANLNVLPGVSDAVGMVKDQLVGFFAGAAESVTFGFSNVIMAFLEGGYFDIPRNWSDSSFRPGSVSYNLKLISPYGNPISQLQNIYIPLSCLLAGALPMAVGKASYASPFLVQLWDQGRQQVSIGLIESLTITRGTSNLPFTNRGKPLAIDVSFSIMDLTNIIAMPVGGGNLTGNVGLDEDSSYRNFLAVLSGQSLYDQVYPLAKAKLNLNKIYAQGAAFTSAARWGSFFGGTMPGRALNALLTGNTLIQDL